MSLPQSWQPSVLSSSLQYGIVSRSFPLTGKILRGYLDAAGSSNGLGIGNPNAEFSPDITKCAITSEGGTAKVLWGFRNGTVAFTTASKAMEAARPVAAKWVRCAIGDSHDGAIEDAIWASGSAFCVTGGIDGRVKLWEAKRATCLWTSEPDANQLFMNACVKLAFDVARGIILGVMQSGDMFIWSGFVLGSDEPLTNQTFTPKQLKIASQKLYFGSSSTSDVMTRDIKAVHLHCSTESSLDILLVYENHPYFYRVSIDLTSDTVERFIYGDGIAFITSLQPVFASKNEEFSFIVVGDQLGHVSIYPWARDYASIVASSPVSSSSKFDTLSRGGVTALAWTPTILVTGTFNGILQAWDSSSFAVVRYFPPSNVRPSIGGDWDSVSQIIVEGDLMIASIGKKITGWYGGPPDKQKHNGKGKQVKSTKSSAVAKWHQQVELYRDIAESRLELADEQSHTRRVYGREREHQSTLAKLGLSEAEAVEYVLMLSRDEEAARRNNPAAAAAQEEGLLVGEFDDLQTPLPSERDREFFSRTSSRSGTTTPPSSSSVGRIYPPVTPPGTSTKIQVSPRPRPEPMEAGSCYSASSSSGGSSPSSRSFLPHGVMPIQDRSHFPSMSPALASSFRRSISGSPESVRSAWSTPLRHANSERGLASPSRSNRSSAPSSPSNSRGIPTMSLLTAQFANHNLNENREASSSTAALSQMDIEAREAEDLRYAIELSLAEARSRGETT
ncbi:hypothetical protein C8Q75DRAFT_709224 [Abortiporus biennis]|nr:hypothetical protein C8Q75DRAFT_709224 [Abortiporus biennis]